MRTVAPYSDQAAVWVDVVKRFEWKKIVFIHSSDEEGRAMLGKFQNKAEDRGIEVSLDTHTYGFSADLKISVFIRSV